MQLRKWTQKLTPARLLAVVFAVGLLQIWTPAAFITGDGPCHVYNARVLHDLWAGRDVAFYSHYYDLLGEPLPNWFGHILLAGLQGFLPGLIAEKVAFSLYFALLLSGGYALLKALRGRPSYWSLALGVLVFHHPLLKGFYNYSVAIGLFCWSAAGVLWYLRVPRPPRLLPLILLFTLTYFAHPIGTLYLALFQLSAGSVFLLSRRPDLAPLRRVLTLVGLLIANAPSLAFLAYYASRQQSAPLRFVYDDVRAEKMMRFESLVARSESEAWIATAVAWVLVVAAGIAIITIILRRSRRTTASWTMALFCSGGLFLFLYCPDAMIGGFMMGMRAEWYFFFACLLTAASVDWGRSIVNAVPVLLVALFICQSVVQIRDARRAGRAVSEILCAADYIAPRSVVLPLNFSPAGLAPDGRLLADRNWLFPHAMSYLGVSKPLILLDNYEANTGTFPLRWVDGVSPYGPVLSKEEGIEGRPPFADIAAYNEVRPIDYLLLWCYREEDSSKGHVPLLLAQIDSLYQPVYRNGDGRVRVYELRR